MQKSNIIKWIIKQFNFLKLNHSMQSFMTAAPVIISAVLCYQLYLQKFSNLEVLAFHMQNTHIIKHQPLPKIKLQTLCKAESESKPDDNTKILNPLLKKNPNNILSKPKYAHAINNKDVQKFIKEYTILKNALPHRTKDASPYFRYIIDQLEKKKMPLELALLPVIESNYKPHAVSCKGAAGIWQIMPKTGKYLGLKKNKAYDGRIDVEASTKAALNYLEYLHDKFNNDWMLALAAYNAGEGTVSKAIEKNKTKGKPTSFWHLKLPTETRNYVPKFLAIARVAKAT